MAPRSVLEHPGRDAGAWPAAAAVTALFAIGAVAVLRFGIQWWIGDLHAGAFVDITQLMTAGQRVLRGQVSSVYQDGTGLYALPLGFLTALPVVPAFDGLGSGYRSGGLTIVCLYELALGSTALYALRRLAWLCGVRRRLLLLQCLGAVVVLVPELEFGHLEDVMALTLVLLSLGHVVRRNFVTAALLLSVACSFKQWAVMLVSMLVFAAPKGRRVRVAVTALALPAALAVVCVGLDGTAALRAFFEPGPGLRYVGHPGLDPNWLGNRSSAAGRAVTVGLASIAGWRLGRSPSPRHLLVAASAVLLLRPLAETINYSYYWTPGLAVLLVVVFEARPDAGPAAWGWLLAALAWTVPEGIDSSPIRWWVVEAALLAGSTAVLLWRARPGPAPDLSGAPWSGAAASISRLGGPVSSGPQQRC